MGTYSVLVEVSDDDGDPVPEAEVQLYTITGSIFPSGEWSETKHMNRKGKVWFKVDTSRITSYVYVNGDKHDFRTPHQDMKHFEITI